MGVRCRNIVRHGAGNLWKLGSFMVSKVPFVLTFWSRTERNKQAINVMIRTYWRKRD